MSGRRIAVAATLITAIGCTVHPGPGPSSGGLVPRVSPPVRTSSVRPAELPGITLIADFGERPAEWDVVATLPFGSATEDLGYLFLGSRSDAYSEAGPASFGVGADGSVWILDIVKARLAHYSAGGRFLGAIPGLHRLLGGQPFGQDVAVSSDGLYVLQTGGPRTTIRTIRDGMVTAREQTVAVDGREVVLSLLFPSAGGLVAAVAGWREPLGSGPSGFAELRTPVSGRATILPGIPVGPSRWIDVGGVDDLDVEVRFTSSVGEAVQPVRVSTVLGRARSTTRVDGFIGADIQAVMEDAVGLLVRAAGVDPATGHNVDGSWYLQVSNDGRPIVWERVPEDSHRKDIRHLRTFASGPDGSVYQMRIVAQGVQILRRPS